MYQFNKKMLIQVFFTIFSLYCQESTNPMTPPRARAILGSMWASPSSVQSSPETPAASRASASTGLTPQIGRALFDSPASKRSVSSGSESEVENGEVGSFDESSLIAKFSPKKLKIEPRTADFTKLDVSALQREYDKLTARLGVNSDNYYDTNAEILLKIKNRADQLGDSSFMQLPIMSFAHITDPQSTGGYHKQGSSPVQVLVKNKQTGVYGGLFTSSTRNSGEKFSSFFPDNMNIAEIARIAGQAYRNPIAIKARERRLGATACGVVEMLMKSPVEARSVYPIVAYFDTTDNATDYAQLDNLPLTRKRVIASVLDLEGDALYNLKGGTEIFDIAPIVLGNPTARSIYAKVAGSDIYED